MTVLTGIFVGAVILKGVGIFLGGGILKGVGIFLGAGILKGVGIFLGQDWQATTAATASGRFVNL